MLRVAKNLKNIVYQMVPSFAGEFDVTKTYQTIANLETDITNKKFIYPGKIIFVFETKKLYYIDLEIDGNSELTSTITTEWLAHLDTIKNSVDIISEDYELAGYTNTWVYNELINSSALLNVPGADGEAILSKDGDAVWVKSIMQYSGDLSSAIGTLVAEIPLMPNDGFQIYLYVSGNKASVPAKYSSSIDLLESNEDIYMTEYSVINTNDLDITFTCLRNTISDNWEIRLQKSSTDYTISDVTLNLKLVNF